ncbi:MAG: thioredoxin fold domain-containing protein [Nitrospirae bacterium]|nr:thioredoxin fold domain-containing protein [Nitrospirota bacterium]
MNTGPYSDEKIQMYLQENFIAVKTQCFFDKPVELMEQFNIKWTPTLIIHDKTGREHHRMVGYVPINDLFAHLEFGRAKVFFDTEHFSNAVEIFNKIIEIYPQAPVTPEAIFYLGVAEYKRYHDPAGLRRAYDTLKAKYSGSEWSRRAEPYSAIPAGV